MNLKAIAGAATFAHLLGRNRVEAKKAETEEEEEKEKGKKAKPERLEGESDDEYAKRCKEDEHEDGDDDKTDEHAESEKDEDPEEKEKPDSKRKGKKGKKAGRAEQTDDNEDEEMKIAVLGERLRCASIFSCAEAAVRPDLAAHLAFETSMPPAEAVAILKAAAAGQEPRSARTRLDQRMAAVTVPNVGSGTTEPDASSPTGIASRMAAAYKKALGQA